MTLAIHKYFPEASQLILGTMNLGRWDTSDLSSDDISHAFDLVTAALDVGINVIDLADIYTFGKAEKLMGELFKRERSLRPHLVLQSKIGIKLPNDTQSKQYDLSAKWITEAVDASVKRLHDNSMDILFLHRPDPLMQLDEAISALSKLYEQGKFAYLAVSNMHAGQIAYIQSATNIPIIANQLEMSLAQIGFVEDGITTNMGINSQAGFPRGTLEFCQQSGVQLQAWGALAQGMFSTVDESQNQQIKDTALLVQALANEYKTSSNAIVLAWLMRHPSNIQPVVGTSDVDRLRQASEASKIVLSREHWYQLLQSSRGQEIP